MINLTQNGKVIAHINENYKSKLEQAIQKYGKEYIYEIYFNNNIKYLRIKNPLNEIIENLKYWKIFLFVGK